MHHNNANPGYNHSPAAGLLFGQTRIYARKSTATDRAKKTLEDQVPSPPGIKRSIGKGINVADEQEVRRIFRLYLQGEGDLGPQSIDQIAHLLNDATVHRGNETSWTYPQRRYAKQQRQPNVPMPEKCHPNPENTAK